MTLMYKIQEIEMSRNDRSMTLMYKMQETEMSRNDR